MRKFILDILKNHAGVINEQDDYKAKSTIDPCGEVFGSDRVKLSFCRSIIFNLKSDKKIRDIFTEELKKYLLKIEPGNAKFWLNVVRVSEDSDIYKKGFKEVEKTNELLKSNCPYVLQRFKQNFDTYLSRESGLYLQEKEEYSLFNRLAESYVGAGVTLTKYLDISGFFNNLKPIPDILEEFKDAPGINDRNLWDFVAKDWLNYLYNTKNPVRNIWVQGKLPKLQYISLNNLFNRLFKEQDYEYTIQLSEELISAVKKALHSIKSQGDAVEKIFEKEMMSKKLKYIDTGENFGFVDRFLGIDFIYYSPKYDIWVPVQVKTVMPKGKNRIDGLGCRMIRKAALDKDGSLKTEIIVTD